MDYYSQLPTKLPPSFTTYIPFRAYRRELMTELALKGANVIYSTEHIILCADGPVPPVVWAQDTWPDCRCLAVDSINQAVTHLRSFRNRGSYYGRAQDGFGSAIAKKVQNLELKRLSFQPDHNFNFKFTAWTMIDNLLITCERPEQRFPFGWHEFIEDKSSPPNRAYLKLWEVISVLGVFPAPSENVIELGASPGGWTWVLSQFANKVYSVDRAPLDAKIAAIKNISHQEKDAFNLIPSEYDDCRWLFSDIICAPERLLQTVKLWLAEGRTENFVCTIKFKGETNFLIMDEFRKFENSRIVHLYHNKNEVTWIRTKHPQIVRGSDA